MCNEKPCAAGPRMNHLADAALVPRSGQQVDVVRRPDIRVKRQPMLCGRLDQCVAKARVVGLYRKNLPRDCCPSG